MHAERDWLRNHVFPRLEEELRQRRHQLEPIDLRLGVETVQAGTEEARELLVLKVCLDEIKRSRPFLVVLLGDRYGWTPPADRMAAAAQEQGFQSDVAGKSVTALEIEFGILKEDPTQKQRSLFFYRQPLPYDRMAPELRERYSEAHSPDPAVRVGHDRLLALKTRLRDDPELGPRVHEYRLDWDAATNHLTGLEAFGDLVYEKLWAALDEETRAFASQPPPTWEEQERAALAEFIEHRRRDFTGREDLLKQLIGVAASVPAAKAMKPEAAGTAAATLGACITSSAGSGKSALFAELHHRLSNPPTTQSSAPPLLLANAAGGTPRGAQVDSMLRRWIQELADALRQSNPLPEKASPDDVDNTFYSLLHQASTQRRLVVLLDALDQFEPTPRGKYLTWFGAKQWPANARIIATSLPEAGRDSSPSRRPSELPTDAGEPAARPYQATQPVAVLAQTPGIETITLPPLTLTDAEQIGRNIWARYHRQMNPDVLRVLTDKRLTDGTPAYGNPLSLTLALEQLNLLDADDFDRAERTFTGSPTERMRALLLDTAQRMPADIEGLYGWLLTQTEKVFGAPHARAFAAVIALSRFGWRDADLLALVPKVAQILFPSSSGIHPSSLILHPLQLASLRRGFRAHLARRGVLGQLDFFHPHMRRTVLAQLLRDAALVKQIHSAIADHLERLPAADPLRESELMVHLIGADDQHRSACVYAGLPIPFETPSGATDALARYIVLGLERRPNPGLVWATALLNQSTLTGQQVANLARRFNFDLNDALTNTANLSTRRVLFETAGRALNRLAQSDPTNASWQRDLSVSQGKLGDVLRDQGDLAAALAAYREALALGLRLFAGDPSNAVWQRDLCVDYGKVGDMLRDQGDSGGALLAYRESLAVIQRLATSDPSNTDWLSDLGISHNRVGTMLRAQGDLPAALLAYRESFAITQRLAALDPSNAGWQHDLSRR